MKPTPSLGMAKKTLSELVRPNIRDLAPYSCARDEFTGQAEVYLDANENPFNEPFNRYPDPLQRQLKAVVAERKHVPAECIFLGNGSDEAIDLVYRCFAEPGRDNVVAIEPTYGMYRVCADVNDVAYRPVMLDSHFQITADRLLQACDERTKVIWICSPNNPTGNCIDRNEVVHVIESFPGIVVVDEAYADFSSQPSLLGELNRFSNLIVLHTFSKAWGLAAIRLGMAFACPDIIHIFNKVKYPYNVNLLTQQHALKALENRVEVHKWIQALLQERSFLINAFRALPFCREVYPTDANFFLVRVDDAQSVYDYLMRQGIIVRNRTKVAGCSNCLRITVGTKTENTALLSALRQYRP